MPTAEDYGKMTVEECIAQLYIDPDLGLSATEVEKRRKEFGYNEVPEKKVSPVIRFLKRFWGLTAWMLELTVILTIILHKYLDMYLILALLVLNAVLGFIQEHRAANAVETLKQKLQVNSRVLRDGTWQVIPARELVPGDVVRIRAGDFVPGDLKCIKGDLEIDQSALTGESLTVTKGEGEIVFSGSIVKSGEANALVVLTGTKTYFGRTAELVQLAKPRLHAEAVIAQVVKWLMIMVGVFVAAALVVGAILSVNILNVLPLMLILLVSAIPVALPAMFTISMALGSLELVKRGVLITRLNASEDAASMDTLCVDKTGTITLNQLSIAGVLPLEGFTEKEVLLYGALASQAANRDPIDMAFLDEAEARGITTLGYRQTEFTPFSPKTRRTESTVEHEGDSFRLVKGAVKVIADLAGVDPTALEAKMVDYASRGYRTLAVAIEKDGEKRVTGLVALYDKPRPDARALIEELKKLGVAVKMLTGDALPIAMEIGAEVGLGTRITRISEVEEALESDPVKAADIAESSDGFAEIYPEDKYALVKALQAKRHIVGMTGDGVNDGPALKQAEVGIAVSSATDVAKAAASAVLTSEGLSNIVDLVKVGRMIYERILTWIFNKVVKTMETQIFIIVAFFLTGRFVVSAFDMVLLLLLTDFITLTISTDNTRWSLKPNVWDVGNVVRVSVIIGVAVTLESLLLLYVGMVPFGLARNIAALHTYAFAILFYFGTIKIFVVRERGRFWESVPSKALFWTMVGDVALVAVLCSVGVPGLAPISWFANLSILIMCLFFALVVDDPIKYWLLNRSPRPAATEDPGWRGAVSGGNALKTRVEK